MENRRGSGAKFVKNPIVEVASICVFALSVFALFSLFTYNSSDPSVFSNVRGDALNACGRVGAYLSSLLLQGFGMGAFLLPAALFFMAVTIYKREGSTRLIGTLGGMTIAVMSLTVFLTLQWKYVPYAGTLILTGGAFGAWVAEGLLHQFNNLGASIVSLVVFCLAIVLSTPVSVARMGAHVLRALAVVGGRVGRVIGTYLLYLGGLVAMRTAHAAGDLLQKLIEGAIKRGQERAAAVRGTAPRKKGGKEEIDVESEVIALPDPATEKKKRSKKPAAADLDDEGGGPVIGVAALAAAAGAKDASASAPVLDPDLIISPTGREAINILDSKGEKDEKPAAKKAKAAKSGPTAPAGASAKPAVDEEDSDSDWDSDSDSDSAEPAITMPAILPPEKGAYVDPALGPLGVAAKAELDGHENVDAAIAAKVAQRLARAKKALKVGQWKLPSIDMLKTPPKVEANIDRDKIMANAQLLTQKLKDFGIAGEITAVRPGPVITLYEFKPAAGVKVSRIASLVNDLSMALSAQSVRILAPIPGKSVVGIEIPSDVRETVYMKEFLQHPDFFNEKFALPVVMGKDIGGTTYLSDLAKMPHLLVAGQTGSGKSVFMNGLICSLLFRYTPDELRMILIDPKFIEFSAYQNTPHLLLPVVDDPKNAATALRWAVQEMERRYRILAKLQVRNLASYNSKVDEIGPDQVNEILTAADEENDEDSPAMKKFTGQDWEAAFELDENGVPRVGKLPYVVVIIDELADLMMIAKKEVEVSIARIAQKARAAGIHLVIATQRPSTDVVTGLIKANLPSRVSCRLASQIDSRTILDSPGAERLLGQGDMLFIPPGSSSSIRLHGAYLSDDEISKITGFLKEQGKPVYRDEILQAAGGEDDEDGEGGSGDVGEADDELMQEAIELVKHSGHASASYLQRHLKVGYNRAARMIETMEMRGVVGPADGAKPRQVLIR